MNRRPDWWMVVSLALSLAGVAWAEPLVVELRPKVAVLPGKEIRLCDVASLRGGSTEQRERLATLDLDDPPRGDKATRITAAHVSIRLQLAGVDVNKILVRGTECDVTASETERVYGPQLPTPSTDGTLTPTRIEDAAREAVRKRLPYGPDDLEIRLAQPIRVASLPAAGSRLDAEVRSAWPPLGLATVAVRVETDGQRTEVPVFLDVKHLDDVVVTRTAFQRGQLLRDKDLHVDRRPVNGLTNYFSDPQQLVGKQTLRAVSPLQVLRNFDVSEETAGKLPLVRRQSRVRLVARTANLSIEVEGEALADGQQGELISFRNVKTGKTVVGRVTGPGEAAVAF